MCEGFFLFVAAYEKILDFFVCILCFKRMFPGKFQDSDVKALWFCCKFASLDTALQRYNQNGSHFICLKPRAHMWPSAPIWALIIFAAGLGQMCECCVFPEEADSGIFSGSQCCLFYPVYVCVLKVKWIPKMMQPLRALCINHHISRNTQRN